ncbi:MAG: 4-hydroxy-3-methylbut-2-enyl diphosphate reductase [Candidatus Caldatribacteriaceae bacterium]
MKITVIEPIGFCEGVRRAFQLALQTLKESKREAYLLGELVHNRHAVERLQKEGARLLENPEDIPFSSLVITRSHGIEKKMLEKLKERDVIIVDTTCPRVRKLQNLAQNLEKEGYKIFILGNRQHPEIQSLLSFLEKEVVIFQTKEEWESFDWSSYQKQNIAILEQTTFPKVLFESFCCWQKEKWPHLNVEIFHTLCSETETRQASLVKNVKDKELTTLLVIGGYNSSNTLSLVLLARQEGTRTIWVEGPEDLTLEMFNSQENVGVVSGASTPDWIVNQIIDKLTLSKKFQEKT